MKYKIYIGFLLFLLVSTPVFSQDSSSDEEGGMFAVQKTEHVKNWSDDDDDGNESDHDVVYDSDEMDMLNTSATSIETDLISEDPNEEPEMTHAELLDATDSSKIRKKGKKAVTPGRLARLAKMAKKHSTPSMRVQNNLLAAIAAGHGASASNSAGRTSYDQLPPKVQRRLARRLHKDDFTNKIYTELSATAATSLWPKDFINWEHMEGNSTGGGHLLSELVFNEKARKPTVQHCKRMPFFHPTTKLWAGIYHDKDTGVPPTFKTGFPLGMTKKALGLLHQNSDFVAQEGLRRLDCWKQDNKENIYVESILNPNGGAVNVTSYPIFNVSDAEEGLKIDQVIPHTSTEALYLLAHTLLSKPKGNDDSPIRYNSDHHIIVDVASTLNLKALQQGVYVKFLKTNFSADQLEE